MFALLALIAAFASSVFNIFTAFDTTAIMELLITSLLLLTTLTIAVKIFTMKRDTTRHDDDIDPRVHPLRRWSVTETSNTAIVSPYNTTSYDTANSNIDTYTAALLDANTKLRRWSSYDNKLLRRQVTSYEDVRNEKLMDVDDLFQVLVELPMGGMQCAVMLSYEQRLNGCATTVVDAGWVALCITTSYP
ncbi:hypothetical protein BDV96DRAFT_593429 [Lophiotrema nucula]|uniref:Uncharacterized protein n=1 Tax=Lophiotrema nucula TaxID=690887 RepID=A0A6A5ZTG4_9PLEO|nr:hypothetical protein BDV96DRAFT_593429 [Lophiotrema nucula]